MRLRRRSREEPEIEGAEGAEGAEGTDGVEPASEETAAAGGGPWDASEVTLDEDDETRIDLGSLSVKGHPGIEVRLQVDEASQQVAAVMLVAEDGAVELRAFAAARHEPLWPDVLPQIRGEATRRGGTATEVEGPWGTALQLVVPVVAPDGATVSQQSTIHGIPGPRWMLRATMLGRPAVELKEDGLLEQAVRDVVVVRGTEAMPPGETLPLRLPGGARIEGPDGPLPGGPGPA